MTLLRTPHKKRGSRLGNERLAPLYTVLALAG
jgi:hypothetical protein